MWRESNLFLTGPIKTFGHFFDVQSLSYLKRKLVNRQKECGGVNLLGFPIVSCTIKGESKCYLHGFVCHSHPLYYWHRYTSLGSTFNTFPNPVLNTRKGDKAESAQQNSTSKEHFQPAYMLEDGSLERAGRMSKKSTDK